MPTRIPTHQHSARSSPLCPASVPASLPAVLLTAGLLSACGNNGLSQSWQLDRARILAVRAEPAEPRPGQDVSFEALYYMPQGVSLDLSIWFACLPDAADSFGCSLDPTVLEALAGLDLESMTPEEQSALFVKLSEAGLIGVEPLITPTWTAPKNALDGLDETARIEGVSALINITAMLRSGTDIGTGIGTGTGTGTGTGADTGLGAGGDTELAFKRLPISEALTPNHNPELTGFLIDGEPVELGATISQRWGEELEIEPILADDAVESYTYRSADGVDEDRIEEPYVSWYTEDGSYDQPFSLYPYLTVAWTPPTPQSITALAPYASSLARAEARSIQLTAVVRDRRGGMGWGSLHVYLSSPDLPW